MVKTKLNQDLLVLTEQIKNAARSFNETQGLTPNKDNYVDVNKITPEVVAELGANPRNVAEIITPSQLFGGLLMAVQQDVPDNKIELSNTPYFYPDSTGVEGEVIRDITNGYGMFIIEADRTTDFNSLNALSATGGFVSPKQYTLFAPLYKNKNTKPGQPEYGYTIPVSVFKDYLSYINTSPVMVSEYLTSILNSKDNTLLIAKNSMKLNTLFNSSLPKLKFSNSTATNSFEAIEDLMIHLLKMTKLSSSYMAGSTTNGGPLTVCEPGSFEMCVLPNSLTEPFSDAAKIEDLIIFVSEEFYEILMMGLPTIYFHDQLFDMNKMLKKEQFKIIPTSINLRQNYQAAIPNVADQDIPTISSVTDNSPFLTPQDIVVLEISERKKSLIHLNNYEEVLQQDWKANMTTSFFIQTSFGFWVNPLVKGAVFNYTNLLVKPTVSPAQPLLSNKDEAIMYEKEAE